MQVFQLLNLILGNSNIGQQMFHFIPGILDNDLTRLCKENCYFQEIIGKGDNSSIEVCGRHKLAEEYRIIKNEE